MVSRFRFQAAGLLVVLVLGCQREQRPVSQTPVPTPPAGPAPVSLQPVPALSGAPSSKPAPARAAALLGLPGAPPNLAPFGPGVVQGRAVVTSVEPQATAVGLRILEAGGNAVDAAVATAFALAVTHPSAGNIGGGGFMLLRLGDVVEAIDFRENAPAALTDGAFRKMIAEHAETPVAVGVPGTVAGLHLAHERHGRLPWEKVVEGAIALARDGTVLGARQHKVIGWNEAKLQRNKAARRIFLPGGLPGAGARILQPGLAEALTRIQKNGTAGFYEGETAADLLASLGPTGLLTAADLTSYRATLREPLFIDYAGVRVVTMPPPSGGGLALVSMLSMLESLRVGETAPGSAARYHLLAEVSRRAQIERQLQVAPPGVESPEVEAKEREGWIHANTWLTRHPVDPEKKTPSRVLDARFAHLLAESEHTTHLSVVDKDGGVVSCTVTLSASFGSGIVTKKTGIVLNNSVGSFATVGKNIPRPGVRTISSMAPTLVFVGPKDVLVLGSPGGDTIPSTIVQLVLGLVDDRRTLAEVVAAPRIFQPFAPDELSTERGHPLPLPVLRELGLRGHQIQAKRTTIGAANIAAYFGGRAGGVHDEREGGEARALEAPE
jgi:gamma-glutamyltranspeptidase / glutathione hydrolase